ncbi:blue-light-activated histidine kinase [Caulobacter segnis]
MSDVILPAPRLHGDEPVAASAQGRADRRELSFIAVERTRMPIVIADARAGDNPIVLANQAFLALTGYAADEVLGRNCRFLQGPETSAAAVAQIRLALAAQQERTVELLNYRKDGSTFWNRLLLSPVHDDQGELLYVFSSQLDVTQQRKAEALAAVEHRLLREVDHRAMNALAVVQGIVRLSRADDPARYAAAIQRRVQALATAHALLGRQGWSDIDLEHLFRELFRRGGDRVTLAGPPFKLGAPLVQPLALVLHEMIVNALQHGSLSHAGGRVTVCWTQAGDTGLLLSWTETGGPAPTSLPSSGFGLTMISAIIERQLRGRARLAWRPDGLTAEFTLPRLDVAKPFELSASNGGAAQEVP